MNKRAGFTLLELSIVLVIIGLVVGGVLVGTDLIKSAKLQKVMREAQSYQNGVSAFKLKYNGLPGDLENADDFFPDQVWNLNTVAGLTNPFPPIIRGDRVIHASIEGADAWRQLALAGLIGSGNMGGAESCGVTSSSTDGEHCEQDGGVTAPHSAYSENAHWYIGHDVFTRKNVVMLASGSERWGQARPALSSLAAYNIDQKMDDGMPNSGAVRDHRRHGQVENTEASDSEVYTFKCQFDVNGNRWQYDEDEPYARRDGEPACSLAFPLGI